MDAIYRYQRYVYDATRKYYLLGRDRLLAELQPPAGGSVLEIACGTGRNLILAARRYPNARFYGFDISNAMLDTAPPQSRATGFPSASVWRRRTPPSSPANGCLAWRRLTGW